jgi:hypothetical protein
LQFSLQAVSPETFGYTLVVWNCSRFQEAEVKIGEHVFVCFHSELEDERKYKEGVSKLRQAKNIALFLLLLFEF